MGLQTLRYGDQTISYDVSIRSGLAGKVAIHVHSDGAVKVDAPPNIDLPAIRAAVRKRARWLAQHVEKIRDRQRDTQPRCYISGESHFYLGRRYVLKVRLLSGEDRDCGLQPSVKLKHGQLQVTTNDRHLIKVKELLDDWYRMHARAHFSRRLDALVGRVSWVGKTLPPLKLISMKKNWGSCSPGGSIVLNPHLVKAPAECIDYVILHELCHLKEHNHSKQFYRLLDRVCPDWVAVKKRLDAHSEVYLNV
jgi:predicted metal-dependent hydrolase